MNHRKVISPTSLAGFLALLAAVAALAAVLTTSTLVEAQTQVPAVTGVSVQPGANAGELDVSWDAHPDGADDYRVSWAPQGENFRTWTNTNWNAYPTGTSLNITGLESGAAYKVKVRARFDEGPNSRWSAVKGATTRPANSAATGLPTASGTALVGETLTVGTSGISDGNGLSNPGFTYQWVRSVDGADTDITSATGSTFLLTYDELDHTVRVRVSFTDDDGYPETLASDATAPVVRPPNASPGGQPAVSGVLAVGKTLTADTSGITDPNGLSNPGFTYQWVRSIGGADTDILGATGSTYTLTSGDEGAAIKVTVAFTDDDGYAETLTSRLTQTVMTEPEPKPGERTERNVPRDAVTLISNTGQTSDSSSFVIGVFGSSKFSSAIKFTTGSATNGYTITEASVKLTAIGSAAVPKLSIYTSASSVPGMLEFTFTNPGSFVNGLNTFTAPANSTLAGSTDYFVVIEDEGTNSSHNYSIQWTASKADDAGAAAGWSLADSRLSRSADDGAWTDQGTDPIPQVAIKGSEQPRVAPTQPQNLRATAVLYASLTLAWDEPDTSITHIRIVRTGGNLPEAALLAALTGTRDSHASVRLEPDTSYTFTVEFGNSATEFGPAATINVRTLPIPAPTNVRVFSQSTAPDAVGVIFKWDNPAETLFLESSIAVYDATLQIEEDSFDYTDLHERIRLTREPETTHNFATWYRTEDENGAYHEGPKAYLEFTTARLPEVSISDASVEEGGTLTFTLTITDFADGREQNVRVTATLRLGNSEPEDYTTEFSQGGLVFHPGESTETVEFPTFDDDLYEGDETTTIELSNLTGGLTIGRGTATGTIIDNDPLPLLSPLDTAIAEDYQGLVLFCIESEPAAEQPFDVALRYSGTATPGADYNGVNTLTLAGGNTPHCHQITIIDDNIYEGDETIIYTLQEEPGSYRVARAGTITILENDPVPSLTVTAFPGVEGGRNQGNTPVQGQEFGNVVFRFNLDRPAAVPISMDLETIDGAAVRGDDYRFNNPTLVFPAGQTEMFIKLPVIDDAEFDGTRNEDFELVASNPSVPVFTGRLRATGYILDNETPPPGVDYVDDSIRTDAYIDVGESWVNGNAVVGGVEHRYDQDWYRTVLRAGRCYQIEVRGKDDWEYFQEYPDDDPIQEYAPSQELTLSDPLIHGVYTDLGNYMPNTQEEYGGVGLGAVKLVTIDQTGTVYIAVSHAWYGDDDENEGGGTFDLSLIDLGRGSCTRMDPSVTDAWASITYRRHHSVSEGEGRDLPRNISTTGYVQPDGDPATGNIQAALDGDWFKVPLVAGRSYRIELKGDEESDYGGTWEDPWLGLFSSTGADLSEHSEELTSVTGDRGEGAADNDSGRGNNARLEVEVNVTDTYIIVPLSISDTGTYTVVVTTIAN